MCNSAQAGKQTTSAMLGEANQPLAGDPVGRVCLRGVLAGIVTSLAFAAPAWASNPPIAGTAGVANVPTVVANADRTAESTVASAAALPPQSPHGAAVEQAPVSATAKQAIGDAAHAVSGAAAPTSTVAPALEGAAQATHTAGQGVAPLITAATAGVKASRSARHHHAGRRRRLQGIERARKGRRRGCGISLLQRRGCAGAGQSGRRCAGAGGHGRRCDSSCRTGRRRPGRPAEAVGAGRSRRLSRRRRRGCRQIRAKDAHQAHQLARIALGERPLRRRLRAGIHRHRSRDARECRRLRAEGRSQL